MKKFTIISMIVASLFANAASAQPTTKPAPVAPASSNDDFCWGIGLVGVAVISTIVGLTAASASSSPNSYSNTK